MYIITPCERKSYDLINTFHDIENDFCRTKGMASFRTDLKDDGDRYIMEAELPGFEKGDITLDITGDTLRLTAQHKQEKVDKDKQKYIYRERSYGSYQRSFDISAIDADKIEAEYKNGILCLVLPKKEARNPETRRLEIK